MIRSKSFRSPLLWTMVLVLLLLAAARWRKSHVEKPFPLAATNYFDAPATISLCHAIEQGDLSAIGSLLSATPHLKARASTEGVTMLCWAIQSRRYDAFMLLLEEGASPTNRIDVIDTVIHYAAEIEDIKYLRAMLENGAPVDIKGGHGETPIFNAAQAEHLPAIDLLLANGADPDVVNVWGHTAMTSAAIQGRVEAAYHLLQGGADPDAPTEGGESLRVFMTDKLGWGSDRKLKKLSRMIEDMLNEKQK
jgi:ankyrin repeat protein